MSLEPTISVVTAAELPVFIDTMITVLQQRQAIASLYLEGQSIRGGMS